MSKTIKPIVYTHPETGKEITLEFNRASIAKAEDAGFSVEEAATKPAMMIPILFWGAHLWHQPWMTRKETDEILQDEENGFGGLSSEELERLGELYALGLNTLIRGDDEPKNPRKLKVQM